MRADNLLHKKQLTKIGQKRRYESNSVKTNARIKMERTQSERHMIEG